MAEERVIRRRRASRQQQHGPKNTMIAVVMRSALLVSTYDMGRQPFGLASAAAWLRRRRLDGDLRRCREGNSCAIDHLDGRPT